MNLTRQKRLRTIFLLVLFFIGVAYVYFALTPSHYGFFLKNHMGGQDYKPIVGQAYGIRSDEWGMVTPYFQIAANNDYQRINQDSPYKEDLRFYFGLPLKDWALAFKPYMWGFFTLGDARGFSFYHFFMIASFIIGYTAFLMQLRLPLPYSVIIALTLFFSHHNQVWWSNNAAVLSLTIWIIIPFLTNWSLFTKFIATFLISAASLFALIYPPWQISLIYVVGFLALAFRPERFRIGNLLICFMGFALAAGASLYYLWDIIPLVQNTVYPGERSFNGGASSLYYLWTLLFPHSLITPDYRPVITTSNISEIGSLSSLLTLCLIVFGDYKAFFQTLKNHSAKFVISAGLLTILFSWMYLPIPDSIGQFLLLDKIAPNRLLLASGTSLICLVAILAFYTQWILSWSRIALYSILVLGSTYTYKYFLAARDIDRFDVLVLIPIFIVIALKLFRNTRMFKSGDYSGRKLAYLFAIIALSYNFIAFGFFNPIQSAHDVFSGSENPKVVALKEFLRESNIDNLAIPRHTAAAAAGLSIPTHNHVLLTPQLDLFREQFPDMEATTFNSIFNRYAHITFNTLLEEPKLAQADSIEIPVKMLSQDILIESEVIADIATDSLAGVKTVSNIWQSSDVLAADVVPTDILTVKFLSPVAIKPDEISILNSNKETEIVEAAIRPIFLFTGYFSGEVKSPNDSIMWEMELSFPKANKSYEDFDAIYIGIADEVYEVSLKDNQIVKEFDALQQHTYPIQGVIDSATYDASTASLVLAGWAPITERSRSNIGEHLVRWFGYDTDLNLSLEQLESVSRPDVATIYGNTQLLSGFKLVFKVVNPPTIQDDIDFCFYSRTKANGTFQLLVNADNLPLLCDRQ